MDFFVLSEWRILRATYGEQPQKHGVPDAGFASKDVTVKTGPPVAEEVAKGLNYVLRETIWTLKPLMIVLGPK